MDDDDDDLNLVILPPDVGEITDEEDFDENDLGEAAVHDVPGELEIHSQGREKDEEPVAKKKKVDIRWRRGEKVKDSDQVSIESLAERYPLLEDDPFTLFSLFLDNNILQHIIDQSIIYAQQKGKHDFELSLPELKVFLGILLLSGYHTLPQEDLYWSVAADVGVPCVHERMSRRRFREIKKYLHLDNNNNLNPNDKLAKLRSFLNMFQDNLLQFGAFAKELSIDESMLPYYGHHGAKMFIRGKPIRFGFKIWMMTTSTGFPLKFSIYTGKSQDGKTVNLGESVVLDMCSVLEHPENHILYMDNFFSSTKLFRKLKEEKKICCTGTARENRVEKCPLTSSATMKKKEKGAYENFTDGTVAICQWNDNKPVIVLSTNEGVTPMAKTQRCNRSQKRKSEVLQPKMIKSYNQHMGGVDLMDRFLSDYRPKIRAKKWWFLFFTHFLNMAVVAGWRTHREISRISMSHLDFRR